MIHLLLFTIFKFILEKQNMVKLPSIGVSGNVVIRLNKINPKKQFHKLILLI